MIQHPLQHPFQHLFQSCVPAAHLVTGRLLTEEVR